MSKRWVEAFPMRESAELCAGMSVGGRGQQPFTHSANQRWTWHLVCVPKVDTGLWNKSVCECVLKFVCVSVFLDKHVLPVGVLPRRGISAAVPGYLFGNACVHMHRCA